MASNYVIIEISKEAKRHTFRTVYIFNIVEKYDLKFTSEIQWGNLRTYGHLQDKINS